jgi:hypothetical protein
MQRDMRWFNYLYVEHVLSTGFPSWASPIPVLYSYYVAFTIQSFVQNVLVSKLIRIKYLNNSSVKKILLAYKNGSKEPLITVSYYK